MEKNQSKPNKKRLIIFLLIICYMISMFLLIVVIESQKEQKNNINTPVPEEEEDTAFIPDLYSYEITEEILGIDEVFLNQYIEDDLKNYAAAQGMVPQSKVRENDTVVVQVQLLIDGKDITDMYSFDSQMVIVAGSMDYTPLSKELIGKNVNESYDFLLEIPNDAIAFQDYVGSTMEFHVYITSISGPMDVPELTDEFIASLNQSTYQTVDEYKTVIRKSLEEMEIEKFKESCIDKFWMYIEQNFEDTMIPEIMVIEKKNERRSYYEDYLTKNNLSKQEFLNTLGTDYTGYEKMLTTEAKNLLKRNFIIDAVCDKYGIEISEDELHAYILGILYSSEYTNIENLYETEGLYEADLITDIKKDKIERTFLLSKIQERTGEK